MPMENVEIWKIKNFPHYHIFHSSTTAGERRFKKNSFFIFTEDERRKTKDGERGTNGRTSPTSNRKQAKTHKKMHKTGT